MRKRIQIAIILLACASIGLSAGGQDAARLIKDSGVQGGLIVHIGSGDGALTSQLRVGDQYFVHGLDTDAAQVDAARERLVKQGVQGPVSIDRWDGRRLPYANNLVNLIVAAKSSFGLSEEEMLRVLAPNGVALIRGGDGDTWKKIVKPRPKEMDEWTHYLHGPDGNPAGNDTLVGPPDQLQWVGSPRWARHHDHMASLTSMVSSGGRLFYIMDEGPTASIQLPSKWRLIARDAFNGVVLWKREIDQWDISQYPLKSGPAHLLRRLVSIGDRVFVTLGIDAPVTALDAADGKTALTYEGSEFTREIVVADDVAICVADTSRSLLPDFRRQSTYVWANTRRANPDWGWKGAERNILAYSAKTGAALWQAKSPVAPCSLAADAKRVVFHDGKKLVCLDRANGNPLWESEAAPIASTIDTSTGPRVLIYNDVVLFAGNNGKVSSWSVADGKQLWENKQQPSGHQSLKDLFVVQGLAWTGAIAGSGDPGAFSGYDPLTGKIMKEFPADVQVHWFHHRCYPAKATGKYLLTARNGTEFIDLDAEHWKPHHWVRGGCIYGVMPCNGLTYAPMSACGCQLEAKLTGLTALASGSLPQPTEKDLSPDSRLERGPAFGKPDGSAASAGDWPTYRGDAARSGSAPSASVSSSLKGAWRTQLGGRLSAPTIAAGKLFVASIDTHTLHALDAGSGDRLWSRVVGGRIDSPPTYYKGLALFGSADGYVYALRATDGALAWRFRGAPIDRRMMAWEQLESAWPVHGSVLIHADTLYCTAGRNMYIDGGIRLIRLEPLTGRLIGETVMDDKDPETREDMHTAYLKKTQGNNMPVAHSDVLSCDGKNIWMRSQKIDFEGKRHEIELKNVKEQDADGFHLFCQNGFLDDSYFFRSYWTYGRRVSGGYGSWFSAGRLVPSGRILAFDRERVYGFGRKPEYMVNASVLEFELFAADKSVSQEAIAQLAKAETAMNKRSREKSAAASDWLFRSFFPDEDLSAARFPWKVDQPSFLARALTVAGDTLFAAGPPDLIDERRAFRFPDDPDVIAKLERQARALEGREGGELWALSKADGKIAARYALDTIPVFDGMAAVGDRLYVAAVDGSVICLSADGKAPLEKVVDRPARQAWDEPEDPSYLLPLPVSKEGDFDRVTRCSVSESKLGYRLRASGKKQAGMAVKKLERPITGSVVFKTKLKAVAGGDLNSNGYLVFGDGQRLEALVKCGARLKAKRVTIVEGDLLEGKGESVVLAVPASNKALEMSVRVDLASGKVSLTVNGSTVEAKLERALKSITHIGYAVESAQIDFAPIEVVD